MEEPEEEIITGDSEGAEVTEDSSIALEDPSEVGDHPRGNEEEVMGSKENCGNDRETIKEDSTGPHEHKWKPYYIIHIGKGK